MEDKRTRKIAIIVVIVLVLVAVCCCCLIIGGTLAWPDIQPALQNLSS